MPPNPQRAEAKNPHTPVDRLVALMDRYASDVLQNPALPQMLEENPNFWRLLSSSGRHGVVSSTHRPTSFVHWAAQPDGIRDFNLVDLLWDRAVPAELRRQIFLLEPLWKINHDEIERLLPMLFSPAETKLLLRGGILHTPPDRLMSDDTLFDLATLGRPGRDLAIAHPDCPPELLDLLWEESPEVEIAEHPNLSPQRLETFVLSEKVSERVLAASHARLTREQHDLLATDEDEDVRWAAANHPTWSV